MRPSFSYILTALFSSLGATVSIVTGNEITSPVISISCPLKVGSFSPGIIDSKFVTSLPDASS